MARPRVFVSSTFYDLKYARTELERFIRDMGYEPVLNERGNIPYGSKEKLERYCYNEIDKVHVLISIIGGRYGTQSREAEDRSISNMELETAIKQNKQVYIFIEAGVHSEYQTYRKNKSNSDVVYSHVDDARVYKFIDEVYALPANNQIAPFDSIPFVITYLKEQWAGLFEQFLQQQSQSQAVDMMQRMEVTTATLKDIVELLKNTSSTNQAVSHGREKAFDAIIMQNYPLFSALKTKLKNRYRIFFTNRSELNEWLKAAWRGSAVDEDLWDNPQHIEYGIKTQGRGCLLKIATSLFDEFGNLKPMLPGDWNEKMLSAALMPTTPADDDEIPF